jgi:protein subunit release factor A
MSKKQKNKWSLNPQEVSMGMGSSSSGKTGQFSRVLKTTSCTVSLTHEPTGTKVEGEIPSGNYSKKDMQQKREELQQSLFIQLERLVAKKLNIKGQ